MKLSFLQLVVVAIAYTAADVSSLSPSPTSISIAEFSGDGTSDIPPLLPSSSSSGTVSVATPVPSGTVASVALPTVSPTPVVAVELPPAFEDPVVTYGNNTCEPYIAGGYCKASLSRFPGIVNNYSRAGAQFGAKVVADLFIGALISFNASERCVQLAIPIVCRWIIPTCDPAFRVPTYQPLCRYDCEILRDFVCRKPWEEMLEFLHLLASLDRPDCSPLNNTEAGDAPMCVGTTRIGGVPLPQRTGDCYSGTGRGYEGTINVTESGIPCQLWSSTYPHQHLLHLEGFEELEGGHNYCRNPGNRGKRPWCFTTDRGVRWEYCNVSRCASGGVCEPFSLNAPFGVCRTIATIGLDLLFTNKNTSEQEDYDRKMNDIEIATENYSDECKDVFLEYLCVTNFPQCDPTHRQPRPLLPCRSFCEMILSRCKDDITGLQALGEVGLVRYDPLRIEFDCGSLPEAEGGATPECYLPITEPPEFGNQTCYDPTNKGFTYNGTVNITESGHHCQKWNSQVPHLHPLTPVLRPYLDKHNYCRNPEGRGERPWCYTTDPTVRWEYCNIPICVAASSIQLPLWLIVLIAAVGALLMLLILIAICSIMYCRLRTSKEQRKFDEASNPRYTEAPIKKDLSMEEKPSGTNPLYTRNSQIFQQKQLEYDGVKLPEYPRSQIMYIRDLGQGHFGVVVQAEATNIEEGKEKSTVAIKVLKEGASPQFKKEFFREASLMYAFNHPNILKLLGVCIEMEPLCMIFEFMELGDLNDFLRKHSPNTWESSGHLKPGEPGLPTQQLVFISIDIATGLEYLAQNHYVHRDLATRNCLVSGELRVKISDFGLSQDIYSTDYFRLGDSELLPIRWMPPEAILYAKFTTQSDIWSFGIVLWEIFSFGVQPYFSLSNEEVVAHVRDGNVLNCPEKCPQEIYDLMLDCWAMNPSERPTAAELRMGLGRWNPDLSATLAQQANQARPDYQNMATVREYAATQLSANSSSGRALNISSSGIAAIEGQFEVAPAVMNPNGLDAGVAGAQFQMAPVVAVNPPGSTGYGHPTVAYSSCVGEEGSTPQMPNGQHEELTLL